MYGWDPEGGFHNTAWSGTLVVEDPCIYLEVDKQGGRELAPGDERLRSFVRLPAPLTSFDAASGALWVGEYGPMSTGDKVVLVGSDGWQRAWSTANDDGGMHEFTSDDNHLIRCTAHVSFWAASMRPAGADPAAVPTVAQLSGLGLYAWEPDVGHHTEGEGGVLVIEPPCVYFDAGTFIAHTGDPTESEPKRYVLGLPRPFVRFDPDSGALSYGESRPFYSGDEIVVFGGHELSEPQDLRYIAAGCSVSAQYRGLMKHRDLYPPTDD